MPSADVEFGSRLRQEEEPPVGEGFETFVRDISDLRDGHPALLVLRDLRPGRRKYTAQNVIAVVSQEPGRGRWAPLQVRSAVGNRFPGRWHVQVLEVLPQRVPGAPYSNCFDAMEEVWGEELGARDRAHGSPRRRSPEQMAPRPRPPRSEIPSPRGPDG